MMIDETLAEFTAKKIPLKSYEHYIAFIICNPAQSTCYLEPVNIVLVSQWLNTVMDDNLVYW